MVQREWLEIVILTGLTICREWVIVPPAFLIECPILAEVVLRYRELFRGGLIRTPLRDDNLWLTLDKKRAEYDPAEFPFIFTPDAEGTLSTISEGGIQRSTVMGRGIVELVASILSGDLRSALKLNLSAQRRRDLARAFSATRERGDAVTPYNLAKALVGSSENQRAAFALTQYAFGHLYLSEFRAAAMVDVPGIRHHFGLDQEFPSVSFRRWWDALTALGLLPQTLRFAGPEGAVFLRGSRGFRAARATIFRGLSPLPPGAMCRPTNQRSHKVIERARIRQHAALLNPTPDQSVEALNTLTELCSLWSDTFPEDAVNSQYSLLVVTVNEHETQALLRKVESVAGRAAEPTLIGGRLYRDLGTVGQTRVYHTVCEMGSAGRGAMLQAADNGIRALSPNGVVAVGVGFGISQARQRIGDVLVARQLLAYELQRVGRDIVVRGDRPHASTNLVNMCVDFAHTDWQGVNVRIGLVLSGDKLVDNIDYRSQLSRFEPEAIGGDMEGAGLYVACEEHKVDWILIKGICDWADGKKRVRKESRQRQAASNAAQFFVGSLARWRRLD